MRNKAMAPEHKSAFDEGYVALHEHITTEGDVPGPDVYEPYIEVMGIEPGHAVLDLGAGYGRLLPSIRRYTEDVTGADLSERMLRRGKQHDSSARMTLADARLAPFAAACFDHVVSWAMWENIPAPDQAIREVGRVLRPGGRWLVSGKHLVNWRCMRLVYYRRKRAALRCLWPDGARRPVARRLLPARIVAKLDDLWPEKDIPQYPTFFPVFRRQLRAAGLALTRLDRFSDHQLTDRQRLPEGSPFFYYFVAIIQKD